MSKETYAKTAARRAAILELARGGEVSIADLAQRFGVTLSTIRRDVAQLAADGRASRTYGGVAVVSALELDTSHKARQHPAEKTEIARFAAEKVKPGDVVLLDAGTTTGRLASMLREVPELTVMTGGMNALLALHDAPGVDLIVIGGRLRHVNQGMVGPLAEHGLSHVYADSAFMGAEGLDSGLGIACPTLEQATLKRKMMESARDVYVLVDHSKLERRPFKFWAKVPDGSTVITDEDADQEILDSLHKRWNVEIAGRLSRMQSLEIDVS